MFAYGGTVDFEFTSSTHWYERYQDINEAFVDVEKHRGVVAEMAAMAELETTNHTSEMNKVFEKIW